MAATGGPTSRCAKRWRSPTATRAPTRSRSTPASRGQTMCLTNGQLAITTADVTIDGDIDGDGGADITISAKSAAVEQCHQPRVPHRGRQRRQRRSRPRSTASSSGTVMCRRRRRHRRRRGRALLLTNSTVSGNRAERRRRNLQQSERDRHTARHHAVGQPGRVQRRRHFQLRQPSCSSTPRSPATCAERR